MTNPVWPAELRRVCPESGSPQPISSSAALAAAATVVRIRSTRRAFASRGRRPSLVTSVDHAPFARSQCEKTRSVLLTGFGFDSVIREPKGKAQTAGRRRRVRMCVIGVTQLRWRHGCHSITVPRSAGWWR